MDESNVGLLVELLDRLGTIGILVFAWLWERKERTTITNMYLQDMRRLVRRKDDDPADEPDIP
jgi:hypothetical protein